MISSRERTNTPRDNGTLAFLLGWWFLASRWSLELERSHCRRGVSV